MTNMMKTVNVLFSQNNKRFVRIGNKPFLMSALLFKYPKLNQKLIIYIKEFFFTIFNSSYKNNPFIEPFYKNIIAYVDKTESHEFLDLSNDTDINIKKSLVDKYKLSGKTEIIDENTLKIFIPNKKAERYLFLYLFIVNYFFNYIGFPKTINILRKIFIYSSKEKIINNLKIMLEKSGKIYFTKLKINSLYLFIILINLFLMLKKILKSIYIIK